MKVIINDNKKPRHFPKLMVSGSGNVVLFDKSRRGIEIAIGDSPGDLFSGVRNMDDFTDFEGTITLEND